MPSFHTEFIMGSHKSSSHKSSKSKGKEKDRKHGKHRKHRSARSSDSESDLDANTRLARVRLAAQSVRDILAHNFELRNDLRQVSRGMIS